PKALAPKASVSTNSTTRAQLLIHIYHSKSESTDKEASKQWRLCYHKYKSVQRDKQDEGIMSKVAKYLNEHILGEVVTDEPVRKRFATDGSLLAITPEFVIYPRVTNDIRKVARFAWQLAEKGHVLPLTARGGGSDETGAAIGKGAIIATTAHMNHIFEYDTKQKLLRTQPGATTTAINSALLLQGTGIPALASEDGRSTIGGAVGNDATSNRRSKYGTTRDFIHQLEVVLANGDILQTDRLSKRALNKKKGQQGLEGDIYRQLDGLIEDNKDMIAEKIGGVTNDNVGYSAIAQVKHKDGSFDLTPLIAGSQGTLGVISEMILKTEYINDTPAIAILTFSDSNVARDAVDQLAKLKPSSLEYYDAAFFEVALAQGKRYAFYDEVNAKDGVQTVLVVEFDDFSARSRQHALKKVSKIAKQLGVSLLTSDGEDGNDLSYVRDVVSFSLLPAAVEASAPPLFGGVFVPFERFEDFSAAVATLAKKYSVTLPLYGRPLEGTVYARPTLHLHKVGDKQKVFKLLDEYAAIVSAHSGYFVGEGGEGRLKASIAHKQLDSEVSELFAKIKTIFDPYGILNPGVKQPGDLKQLVSQLRSDYDTSSFADFVPSN
ncbi:MAG: FAD-binding oxidoreductase, partial [Candidatus Saccharibacteria bacterium]